MAAIGAEASGDVKFVVEFLKRVVGDFDAAAARPTNQVVMDVLGGFVDKLAAANMRGHDQSLLDQKAEGAVDSRFGEAGELFAGAVVDFGGR